MRGFLMFVLGVLMLTGCSGSGQKTIIIATGEKGGLYHQFGMLLKDKLQKQGNVSVKLLSTKGSSENATLIQQQKVDFSIVQAGVNTFDGIEVVTPLFVEPILMFATQYANVNYIADLSGKTINLGVEGSGSRITGERILAHYEIKSFKLDEGYFATDKRPTYDVSIAVGGLLNKDIKKVVKDNLLKLLPISDAKAIALKHTHLHPFVIPKGIFSQNPPIPQADTTSVASTAILISRPGIDEHLVEVVLKTIYETNLRAHFPLMMTPKEVREWSLFPLKPASLKFLDPYSGIGVFANFAESIAAIKEIIFALVAMGYFAWVGYRRLRGKQAEQELSVYKEKLDLLLDETVRLERLCDAEDDPEYLKSLLSQATNIKLRAIEELTHEQLRGDGLFAIFLTQTSHLINRLEQKVYRNSGT
ncbi:MAG: TAXI family TRAP transporter solute-binding subunit [Algicola sp.]|nr:TAXI family TRAP transporter solute-binding subunit [Algicola sp.]